MNTLTILKPTKKGITKGEYNEFDRAIIHEGVSIIFDSRTNEIIEPFSYAKNDSYWTFSNMVKKDDISLSYTGKSYNLMSVTNELLKIDIKLCN